MAFDGLFLHMLLNESYELLINAKINKIHQPDIHTVTLKLKLSNGETNTLLISAHPQNARIHFTQNVFQNPSTPPLFAMVLRKHAEGGRIINICQNGLDRTVDFTIEARNEVGDIKTIHLITEIMGKHSNIILCNEEMIILSAVRQYGHNVSRYRQVIPHERYKSPPPSGKANPYFLDEEDFTELIFNQNYDLSLSKLIMNSIDGISPATAREIVFRAGLDQNFPTEEAGLLEMQKLFMATSSLIHSSYNPTIHKINGIPKEYYFTPYHHLDSEQSNETDMNSMLDCFYTTKEADNRFLSKKTALSGTIFKIKDKIDHKIMKQSSELEQAENGDKFRLFGELLSANLYRTDNHIPEVTLENFYENNISVTIPLDTKKTASENAGYYFKKYNKAKLSAKIIREQLEKNKEESKYLDSILFQCENALNEDDLAATTSELIHGGYLKGKTRKSKINYNAPLPPIEISYNGYTILIGRNNKQNDRLTLKTASKDDIWLHTKDIPGSHVIVRKIPGKNIPEDVILRAAQYAAHCSKAKEAQKVPVDYTEVKQVKKPNGAKPGMVIYFEQTTIMAKPLAPEITK